MGAPVSNLDHGAAQNAPGPNGNPQTPPPASKNTGLSDMSSEFGLNPEYPKGKNNLLYYPENIGVSGQDTVVISQFQYVAGDLNNALNGSLGNRENDFSKQKTLGTVVLPMVNNLTEANQTGWGEDSLSTIAAGLMAGGTASAQALSEGNLLTTFGEVGGTLANILNNGAAGTRAKQYFTTRAAASVIQKLGIQVNPEAYITRATGAVINPNLELLFNGPKLRAFELAFKMTPRSPKEARNIRAIIKFFKKGMAPRKSNNSDVRSFFLGTPNVFKVQFKSGDTELQSLVEFKTCALVTCTVNYTPDGFYAAYQDSAAGGSQPIAVTLQLGFAELTPVFSDDYDITLDSVGPDRIQFEKSTLTPQESSSQKTSNLTQEEAQKQSSRPENVGRSIEQIQADPGARRLEYQNTLKKLSNKNLSPTQRSQLEIRAQQLSGTIK